MSFGIVFMLLLMVVAAGVGLLIVLALRVPAFSSELNAWLGVTSNPSGDVASARKAQLIFALAVYTAPLAFGLLVALLHTIFNFVDRRMKLRNREQDAGFEME